MNYFVEGIQGSGKSTLVRRLSERCTNSELYREGDYSPVELAWCALVSEKEYEKILSKYSIISEDIKLHTVSEDNNKVICYTQIITDEPGFHKDLEQYEIYNGNKDIREFKDIVLRRFVKWNGENQIFECSIFQNIMENLMLYLELSDEEIIDFYKELAKTIQDKEYKIVYLDVENIRECIEVIKVERSDAAGNELWFPLMVNYLESSPYSQKRDLKGMEGLVIHLERRRELEHRIINEIFAKETIIVKAKEYDIGEIL